MNRFSVCYSPALRAALRTRLYQPSSYLHPDTAARVDMYIFSLLGTSPDKPPSPFDAFGVASVLLGGDEAVSAMSTVHVYEGGRWWLGWYNSPGLYQIAERLSLLGRSKLLDGLPPGAHIDPATLDKLDCPMGPKFRATHSGTIIEETNHIAALFMAECAAQEGKYVDGRRTQPVGVTIAELKYAPEPCVSARSASAHSPILSSIPILISIATCVACGVFGDWYSFALILSGIFAHGISCLAMGLGDFVFTHPETPRECPPGDGILGAGTEIVLLKGPESAVNSITRGRFSLSFSSVRQYRNIRRCSFLLKIQSIAQLFLVPICSQFGQVMFITSLGVSWIYNSWLSLDKTEVRQDILLNSVLEIPQLNRYILGTRTTAVVFILLVLQPAEPRKILNELLPNDTRVWNEWKRKIMELVEMLKQLDEERADRLMEEKRRFDAGYCQDLEEFDEKEQSLFKKLDDDGRAAFSAYVEYVGSIPNPSIQ